MLAAVGVALQTTRQTGHESQTKYDSPGQESLHGNGSVFAINTGENAVKFRQKIKPLSVFE